MQLLRNMFKIKSLCLALLFPAFSLQVLAAITKLNPIGGLEFSVEGPCTAQEITTLNQSIAILETIITSPEQFELVTSCARQNSSAGLPSNEISLGQKWKTIIQPKSGFTVALEKKNLGAAKFGRAPLSSFMPWWVLRFYRKLPIQLNTSILSRAENNLTHHRYLWAGVLAHEILHYLGLKHGKTSKGFFIREFGECVERIETLRFSNKEAIRQNEDSSL